MAKLRIQKAVLVYQAGIANVFKVTSFNMSNYGRDAQRLLQSDFRSAESFAKGLGIAGTTITTAHCNQAGDIINAHWSDNLNEAPFNDKFKPVVMRDGNFVPLHIM